MAGFWTVEQNVLTVGVAVGCLLLRLALLVVQAGVVVVPALAAEDGGSSNAAVTKSKGQRRDRRTKRVRQLRRGNIYNNL